MDKSYTIAMFGAFNIRSFGDTLFPAVLEKEIQNRLPLKEMELFSLGESRRGYGNDRVVHSYEDFDRIYVQKHFDAIVLGGGELFHNRDISFENNHTIYRGGVAWKKPLALGRKYSIPVIINGVGMPYELNTEEAAETRELLQAVNYVSLRDPFSLERWNACLGDTCKAYQIPDTIWSIRHLYSEKMLEETRRSVQEKYGIKDNYFLLQYGTTHAYRQVHALVRKFAHSCGRQLVAFAINACHEDQFVVDHLEPSAEDIVIKEELQPVEIAALLAGTEMFLGTSLHGSLTASAFGRKNVIIDMYPDMVSKLDGFIATAKVRCNVVGDLLNLWDVMETVYRADNFNETAAKQREDTLDEHFEKICCVIEKRASYC